MDREFCFKRYGSVAAGVLTMITLLLSGTPSGYSKEVRGVTDDTIKIGVIGDQTGPVVAILRPWTEGIRTYYRYINDQGGINGRKIKVTVEDDRYNIPLAVAAFKKLIYKDKVLAINGPSGTGMIHANLSLIEKAHVPVISLSLSTTMIKPLKRYVFIIGATYEDGMKIIINYIINNLKVKNPRVAFVTADNEYGKNGRKAAKERLKHYKLELVDEEILNFGDLDATSQVLRLKRARPDYVILHENVGGAVALMRDAKKYKLHPTYFGGYAATQEDTIRLGKEASKNFIGTHYFNSWYENTPGMARLREISEGYFPGVKMKAKHYIEGWVGATVFVEAMKRAGKDLNYGSMVKEIEGIKDFDTKGLGAKISYGPNDHKASDQIRFFKTDIEKNIFVPITGWVK